jgi:cytochrome c-type biogenesis protein CcmH
MMAVIALVLAGGSLGLYALIGAPELPDQPLQARLEAAKVARANRPNQVQAEVQIGQGAPGEQPEIDKKYITLVEQLRETMKERADDPEGWKLLAMHEARIGNMGHAWRAKQKMIALLGDKTSGDDYADLAEYMIVATKGYVSGEAEEALASALKLNAKSPRARYYSGLALAQNGRPDVAYRMWIGLLEEGPEDAPWMALIRGQIGPVARAAGINTADLDAPGPSADDVEAASQMSATDRAEMIRGRVAGLAERLATEGGTPNEWARLIRAYGTLGETGKASAIWNEARETFANNADALAVLLEAAQAAEVAN